MKQTRRAALLLALILCMTPIIAFSALATGSPSLSDVIDGVKPAAPVAPPDVAGEVPPETAPEDGGFDGALPNPGAGLDTDDLKDFSNYDDNKDITNPFRSVLSKVMGTVIPVLVGIISGALMLRVLLDLLYIVAPFLRGKLAPGAAGAMAGGTQGGMGGMNGGMGMGGMGMQGGMGMGMGGMRGRQGMQAQQMQQQGGTQWVSQSAINAVAAGQQPGPDGKLPNEFFAYFKSMWVPLVSVPIMLILIASGALTNVGFYLGDIINNMIQSKVG
ncbi:hypothetical protein FACS1894208_00220 [Clostridia bacterium]|nr:hypothetical protein FACS1894208_00220 [Clostridia bacterium]